MTLFYIGGESKGKKLGAVLKEQRVKDGDSQVNIKDGEQFHGKTTIRTGSSLDTAVRSTGAPTTSQLFDAGNGGDRTGVRKREVKSAKERSENGGENGSWSNAFTTSTKKDKRSLVVTAHQNKTRGGENWAKEETQHSIILKYWGVYKVGEEVILP